MTEPVRVVLADDQALLRGSFRLLIDSTPGMETVGEASDGAMAVELARRFEPDIVLMDLRMPVLDGIAATREICSDSALRGVKILVVTMFDTDEYVYPALRAGASGFVVKDITPTELVAGIRLVAAGDAILAPAVTRRLIASVAQRCEPGARSVPRPVGLTRREEEVLVQIANGLANAEIAERLVISLPTVKTHVSNLLAKLGARDRAQLVIFAYESGLVERGMPEPPGARS